MTIIQYIQLLRVSVEIEEYFHLGFPLLNALFLPLKNSYLVSRENAMLFEHQKSK